MMSECDTYDCCGGSEEHGHMHNCPPYMQAKRGPTQSETTARLRRERDEAKRQLRLRINELDDCGFRIERITDRAEQAERERDELRKRCKGEREDHLGWRAIAEQYGAVLREIVDHAWRSEDASDSMDSLWIRERVAEVLEAGDE